MKRSVNTTLWIVSFALAAAVYTALLLTPVGAIILTGILMTFGFALMLIMPDTSAMLIAAVLMVGVLAFLFRAMAWHFLQRRNIIA
jgi:hypothetical protein